MPFTADSRFVLSVSSRGSRGLSKAVDEARAPACIARAPVQRRLRLLVRKAPVLVHQHHAMTADQQSRQPRGNASRRRRTSRVGQKWQPLAHRRGLVIGDVIDPGGAALECRHRSGRRVSDVYERPDPGAVANDRELPPSNRVEERGAAAKGRPWTVEPSITQSDRFDTFCGLKCRFQVANRIQRPAKCGRGLGSNGSFSVLTDPPALLVGPPGKALRDDSPHAGRPRGREKIVSAPRCAADSSRRTPGRTGEGSGSRELPSTGEQSRRVGPRRRP